MVDGLDWVFFIGTEYLPTLTLQITPMLLLMLHIHIWIVWI